MDVWRYFRLYVMWIDSNNSMLLRPKNSNHVFPYIVQSDWEGMNVDELLASIFHILYSFESVECKHWIAVYFHFTCIFFISLSLPRAHASLLRFAFYLLFLFFSFHISFGPFSIIYSIVLIFIPGQMVWQHNKIWIYSGNCLHITQTHTLRRDRANKRIH